MFRIPVNKFESFALKLILIILGSKFIIFGPQIINIKI